MTKLLCAQSFVVMCSLLFASCFDPQFKQCLACNEHPCPPGQSCIDGLCRTHKDECKEGAYTARCDQACCIDGSCFDLKEHHMPPGSLALWLDWTSLYESDSAPIWSDRSVNAATFTSEGSSPEVDSSSELPRNVLRFDAGKQYLVPSGEEQFALGDSDFLLLIAGSLRCNTTDPEAIRCLVTRYLRDNRAKNPEDKGRGMRLCATRAEQASAIETCVHEDGATRCISAVAGGVPCNQMQLYSLSRTTLEADETMSRSSHVELRRNAGTIAQAELDAQLNLDIVSPLRIGGRGGNSLFGEIALVALVVGKVEARERCELERFVLQQLAAANMDTTSELPDCAAL